MSPAEMAAETLPPPGPVLLPTQCSCCGAVLPPWETLPYVGVQDFGDDEPSLELRNHGCGTTLARELSRSPREEHRRDDAIAEERAEREAEWREGPASW